MDWLLRKRTIYRRGRFVVAAALAGPTSVALVLYWASLFSISPGAQLSGGLPEALSLLFLYLFVGFWIGLGPALVAALLIAWRRRASVLEAVIITVATTASLSFLLQPNRTEFSPLTVVAETGMVGLLILPGMVGAGVVAAWWGAFRDHDQK